MSQPVQGDPLHSIPPHVIRRNRMYFIGGAVLVLAIASMFAWGAHRALVIRSLTGSEFSTYVVDHHIGAVGESDDASGFQGDFAVLTLDHPFPQGALLSRAKEMAWQYYNLDGGTNLTIQYQEPGTRKMVVQASTVYLSANESLTVNLRGPNVSKSVVETVQWPNNNGS